MPQELLLNSESQPTKKPVITLTVEDGVEVDIVVKKQGTSQQSEATVPVDGPQLLQE